MDGGSGPKGLCPASMALSMANYGIEVFALRKLHLSGVAG
jgi:hypothetical protein